MRKLEKLLNITDKKELKKINKIVDEIEKLEETKSKLKDVRDIFGTSTPLSLGVFLEREKTLKSILLRYFKMLEL